MNIFNFIKQKVSILDVVSQYASLKKAGLYWKGNCPFHHEKTPSFSVSPHKEIFYCFGCHVGGDVISFIAKIENCSQSDAARQLVEQYSITLPDSVSWEKSDNTQEEKRRYTALCTLIAQWTHTNLLNNKAALEYVLSRNITKNNIEIFMLGYFPGGHQAIKNLLNYAQKQGFLAQDFINLKILLEGNNGLYSPFEERILFPIKDNLGRLCGFGGRIFKPNDERPKYYNSHDHQFFSKGSLLFGLDIAKKSIQEQDAVFLVEGYIDVIAMVQSGYTNTIATLGTACTQEHLKQIGRYTKKVYVTYDGDAAGQKAIIRLIELCWQTNIDLYIITLVAGEDPASFLQKNDLKPLISSAKDIFNFYIDSLSKDFLKKSLHERLELTKKIIEMISKIPDILKQDLLLQKASAEFNIPFETLKHELTCHKNKKIQHFKTEKKEPDIIEPDACLDENNLSESKEVGQNKISLLEKKLFSAILSYKGVISPEDKDILQKWLPKPLCIFFTKITESNSFDQFDEEQKRIISRMIMEAEEQGTVCSLEELLVQFYKKVWKIVVTDVKLKIKEAQKTGNNSIIKELLEHLDLLRKKMLQRGIAYD